MGLNRVAGGGWQAGRGTAETTSRDATTPPPVLHLGGTPVSVVGRARIYVCGVTPYDVTHLGHAATFVWVDAAERVLRRLGVPAEVCRNVTDLDDVLFDAAAKAGAHYDRFAAVQQFHFDRDMDALGVRRPGFEPRAHTFVPQVIDRAAAWRGNGIASLSQGSVYFRGGPVADRAGLFRNDAVELLAQNGGRNDDPAKADLLDQAVGQHRGAPPGPPCSTGGGGSAGMPTSRPGRARGGPAVRAGTPSARRWRCRRTA